mmetsp:Transcript_68211/g.200308  ORF Transcript_68211/g.200308 Transcript_68211/m.200308 type:complete len:248 (+) Transcript_68211:225-968(+)
MCLWYWQRASSSSSSVSKLGALKPSHFLRKAFHRTRYSRPPCRALWWTFMCTFGGFSYSGSASSSSGGGSEGSFGSSGVWNMFAGSSSISGGGPSSQATAASHWSSGSTTGFGMFSSSPILPRSCRMCTCPLQSLPQTRHHPSVVTTRLWQPPAATRRTLRSPRSLRGSVTALALSRVTQPCMFEPQPTHSSEESRARAWEWPAATTWTFPRTTVGRTLSIWVPSPSRPPLLWPQARSVPLSRTAML